MMKSVLSIIVASLVMVILIGVVGCEPPSDYDVANEKYSRNLFLIALPLGILIIVLGAMIFGLESVGAGLMGGGVGVILYGVGNYWRYSEDLLKFLLSLTGLVIVIYFSYWFNKKSQKKK